MKGMKLIGTWVKPEQYDKFKELCAKKDISMSKSIRKLIKAAVEAAEKKS